MLKQVLGFVFSCSFPLFILPLSALAEESKVSCKEVEATEAKCKEYEAEVKACDAATDGVIKANEDAAKKELEACKAKNSMTFAVKCAKELKKTTTLRNTPRQVSAPKIQKDLVKDPAHSCAKSEALGNATKVCKAPAQVMAAMKRNCIKG